MRRPAAILMPAAVALACLFMAPSCRPKTRMPAWAQTAPADTLAVVSGEASWMLTQKEIQSVISREPMVERALDLFLQKARINPRTETGRVTFQVFGTPPQGASDLKKGLEHVLVQLNQFKDPAALISALAESFPQEGALRIHGRDWPLFVILDVETQGVKAHIRAASDEKGQIWIGSLESLNHLALQDRLGSLPDVALAAEWIDPKAPFQGFIRPEPLLGGLRKNLDESGVRDLPQGVNALFWSITPGQTDAEPIRFELALAGMPEGIDRVTPWLQRLVAAANAVQSAPGTAPELMQEKRRVGLRCTLAPEQLKMVMDKLGQPGFSLRLPPAPPRGGEPKA
jgi:hypothetical protein